MLNHLLMILELMLQLLLGQLKIYLRMAIELGSFNHLALVSVADFCRSRCQWYSLTLIVAAK